MFEKLKKLKKSEEEKQTKIDEKQVDTLIIGKDISCLEVLSQKLKDNIPCKIILDTETSLEKIITSWNEFSPLIRDEKTIEVLKSKFPEIDLITSDLEPVFYKDQKLKSFNGKTKPEKLLDIESCFIQKFFQIDYSKLFNETDFQVLSEKFEELSEIAEVHSIQRNDEFWHITFNDESKIKAKNLYWGLGYKKFFDLFESRENFDLEIKKYFLNFKYLPVLQVKFELNNIVEDHNRTIFFPISYTHEHGHFILDIWQKNNSQIFSSLIFVNDDMSDDEIYKRIRLLKRSISKVYPDFTKYIANEDYSFKDKFFYIPRSEIEFDFSKISNNNFPTFLGTEAKMDFSKEFKHITHVKNLMNTFACCPS